MTGLLSSSNFQWVLTSAVLLGMAAGMVGTMANLRKQGLMSDAISHAALPGVILAFLISGEKQLPVLITGAAISGLIAAFFIQSIKRTTRIKEDAAMGIILSVFFGGGIMLLSIANRVGGGSQSGLDRFIFGQAASMVRMDAYIMGALAVVVMLLIFVSFKEWKVVLFDPRHAKMMGIPVRLYSSLYTLLLVLVIVIGIQAVGVILMAAMLIIPAISSRYWTHSLFTVFVLSAVFGGVSGGIGTLISSSGSNLPTGPFIVVTSSLIFLLSLFFGTKKGLLFRGEKLHANRRYLKQGGDHK
ncbi:metal ABC transporter permease [Jeotgalibacillus sp. S-D1]|uniref:metal ABC transporter permease n=1 Tax=Jeotgalibacillus sp. S-D1 TaxID=2552189 RepID=UPI0010595190|nr:iron chelate uptake ABC transporter family permease subunit [Jeotgalibacillus sp. S-D1]TDL34788.1 metal ABC transporter permease [Jeotgalibacillus sp. S-D1]